MDRFARALLLYLVPLAADVVLCLALFAGRHSFAERGLGEREVGAILLVYGLGYLLFSLLMGRVVSRRRARGQMVGALLFVAGVLFALAGIGGFGLYLAVFAALPCGMALFFNAFQAFMVEADAGGAPAGVLKVAGRYTASWSAGFALAPLAAAGLRDWGGWGAAHYGGVLAALFAALCVLSLPACAPARPASAAAAPGEPQAARARPLAGWWGIAAALTAWDAALIWWPVLAARAGYAPLAKGSFEFLFYAGQVAAALFLARRPAWPHRPGLLPLFALLGAAGFLCCAAAPGAWCFLPGAALCGLYTGSAFVYLVYHALLDRERAIRRVAVNEALVGLSGIVSPFVAALAVAAAAGFAGAFAAAGVFVFACSFVQWRLAAK